MRLNQREAQEFESWITAQYTAVDEYGNPTTPIFDNDTADLLIHNGNWTNNNDDPRSSVKRSPSGARWPGLNRACQAMIAVKYASHLKPGDNLYITPDRVVPVNDVMSYDGMTLVIYRDQELTSRPIVFNPAQVMAVRLEATGAP